MTRGPRICGAAPGALLARLKAEAAHPALAELDELAPVRRTDRGITFRGRRAGQGWSVAVKLYAGADAEAKARRVFEQHALVFERCRGDPVARVPEPLVRLSDPPGYAMRWVPGRAATSVLRWTLLGRGRRRAELLAQAARWLHAFHHRCGWQAAGVSPGFLLRRLEARLAAPEHAALPRRAEIAEPLALLRDTAPGLGRPVFPKALVHGDFNLQNLVVDGDAAWSVDFSAAPEAVRPVSHDIVCCLFFLEIRDRWPATDRSGTPGGFDRAAVEIFAAAYPDLPWQAPATAWLFLHHQLWHWASLPRLHMAGRADVMVEMCRNAAATLAARTA